MAITDEDVLHVARLARLALTPEEVTAMASQLAGILSHVEALSSLDLTGVPPTGAGRDLRNVTRSDRRRPSWPLDEVLRNAPDPSGGGFRVPAT